MAGEIRYQPRSMVEIASLLDELPVQDMTEEQQDALAFIRATDADDVDGIRQLLADGRDAAAQVGDVTALHFAVRNGNSRIIKLLLDADDNRDYGLPGGDELTMELACRGMDDKVLAVLVENGLQISYTNSDDWRIQDLDYSSNPQMLDYLLADRPEDYVFAEMIRKACFSSNPDYLRHMLVRFGDIRKEPFMFDDALHNTEMMQVMIDKGLTIELRESSMKYEDDKNPRNVVGSLALSEALTSIISPGKYPRAIPEIPARSSSVAEILQFLHANGAQFDAAGEKHQPWVNQILMTPDLEIMLSMKDLGYDIIAWAKQDDGFSESLAYFCGAVEYGERHPELSAAEVLDQLQSLGIDIRQESIALHLMLTSMEAGNEEIMAELLSRGVPVSLAMAAAMGDVDSVGKLYAAAGDTERTNAAGYAARFGHSDVFELLVSLGAEIELADMLRMDRADLLESELESGRDPDDLLDESLAGIPPLMMITDEPVYATALQQACASNDASVVRLLIEHGAAVQRDTESGTLLPLLMRICMKEDSAAALEVLLDDGILSSAESYGKAIDHAFLSGSFACAALLMDLAPADWQDWSLSDPARSYADNFPVADAGQIDILKGLAADGGQMDTVNLGLLTELSQLAANHDAYNVYGEAQPVANIQNVRLWLEAGADPNANDGPSSPLNDSSNGVMELAVRSGNAELLSLLVEYGGSMPPASELAPLLLKDYLLGEIRLSYGSLQY